MDVTINETEVKIPAEITTWGDLLDWVETEHLQAGQCITHVYMGGNEAYDYRDMGVCAEDLNSVGNIAIHSGDFDKVVHESLVELQRELQNARETAGVIISFLENRNEEEAYRRLAELLDSVRVLFAIFSEDLGWSEPSDAEISRQEFSAALERALTQLITAQ